MSTSSATPGRSPELTQKYFSALAPTYDEHTGNTTRRLLSNFLSTTNLKFSSTSLVHDNACGNGTATDCILEWCQGRAIFPPTVIATDFNSPMIEAMAARVKARGIGEKVTAEVMDSQKLVLPSETFTHVVCNFSIFTFAKPLVCLAQVHRVLKPNGLALVSCWKRFGVGEVMKKAKEIVTGESVGKLGLGEEFEDEGYLAKMVDEAGFESGKIRAFPIEDVIKGGELEGVKEFMMGPFSSMVRQGLTEEQDGKWKDAVSQALEEEVGKHGGIKMEAWFVIARRWDALYA